MGDKTGTKPTGAIARADKALRAYAMDKPLATEHFPWGERAIKVKGKVFLFMYADATKFSLSCKLPETSNVALMLPFAEPTARNVRYEEDAGEEALAVDSSLSSSPCRSSAFMSS